MPTGRGHRRRYTVPMKIAVLQQKGGVGKTTLATNLGAAAHLAGRRTLIVDLDRQGSAFDWFSARSATSALRGLCVVKADRPLAFDKLRSITQGYDVVVFDGPPRVGDMSRSAAIAADVVLIPLRPGPLDFWATAETLEVLDSADGVRAHLGLNPVERVFVLNGLPPRGRIVEELRAALTELAAKLPSGRLSPVAIGSRVAFPRAMFDGESVLTLEHPGPGGDEIQKLFNSITNNGKAA